MDKEDEILKKMLEADEMPYLEDNGFTRAVMDALPPGRAYTDARRMVIVLCGAISGCAAFGVLAWDGIRALVGEAIRSLPEMASALASGSVSPAIYVMVSLCSLLPIAFALRVKFR